MAFTVEVKQCLESNSNSKGWVASESIVNVKVLRQLLNEGIYESRLVWRAGRSTPFRIIWVLMGFYSTVILTPYMRRIASILWRAFGPAITLFTILCIAGIVLNLPLLYVLANGVVVFLAVVIIHELGHVCTYIFLGEPERNEARICSRFIMMSIVREPLQRWRELIVICAGPVAPMIGVLVFWPFAYIAPLYFWYYLALAIAHATILFIPVGDGENLRQVLKGY